MKTGASSTGVTAAVTKAAAVRPRLLSADVAAGPESEDVALVDWADIPWEQLAFPPVVWAFAHFHESRGKTDFAT